MAVRDYKKLANDIRDAVGEENIINATHCATRLRLVLKQSPDDATTQKISSMPGVIQVVETGGQYQIVIGTHAKDVYAELSQIVHIDESAQAEVKQSLLNRIIATMSAVFAPFVYILAAAGLIQGCLIIITQFAPNFANTGTYEVLSFLSWTPFTFLPAMIAVTASKHFKCNTFIALWCCLALCNNSWAEIATRIAGGEVVRFLGIRMAQTTYTSTVLPPLFLVLILSYLERWLNKHLPDIIKALATPFICAVIMVPLTILVIGPLSELIADALAVAFNFLVTEVPIIAAIIVGGLWEVLVIFGVHWGVTPMVMANFTNYGSDAFQAFQTFAVIAQAAACFGVFIRSKNKQMKNVAVSAGVTGIFGITEPAIYGVTLRLKKPMVAGCIAGAIGAVVAALFGSRYYAYAGLPGLLTTVNAISDSNPMSFPGMMIGVVVTIVAAIVLTVVIGFDDPVEQTSEEAAEARAAAADEGAAELTAPVKVAAPLNGKMIDLKDVNDPTFSAGVLGQGAAIIPSEGKLYAPCDCTVSNVFDTKHAIALTNNDGVEMLIHVGLETVSLNGKYFYPQVKDGQKVKKGDLLMNFDLDEIAKNFQTVTPVLITNADDFEANVVVTAKPGPIKVGDALMQLEK